MDFALSRLLCDSACDDWEFVETVELPFAHGKVRQCRGIIVEVGLGRAGVCVVGDEQGHAVVSDDDSVPVRGAFRGMKYTDFVCIEDVLGCHQVGINRVLFIVGGEGQIF